MELGNKILELRKKEKLSQEQLAEKVKVTRQTISKWELEETTPDIKQAKELSKLFNISLDELVGNSKDDILYEKVTKTEDNSNMILKILKVTGITIGILLFLLLVTIVGIVFFANYFKSEPTGAGVGTYCEYNGTTMYYEVMEDFKNKELFFNTKDIEIMKKFNEKDYSTSEEMLDAIVDYIESIGGTCKIDINQIESFSNSN